MITSNRVGDRGAVCPGRALLAGLLRCGHCQRRIQVSDNGKSAGYRCSGATGQGGSCLSFGAVRMDEAVGQAVIEALQPLAVEAALQAMETAGAADRTTLALARSALSEARYKAERAKDQFDAVDPANHNVFHNLAARWEACLGEVSRCEAQVQDLEDVQPVALTPQQRQAFRDLGRDLGRAWGHERATPKLRKMVLRASLVEITARLEDAHIHLLLHWKGGDYTELQVARMRYGEHRWTTDTGTVTLAERGVDEERQRPSVFPLGAGLAVGRDILLEEPPAELGHDRLGFSLRIGVARIDTHFRLAQNLQCRRPRAGSRRSRMQPASVSARRRRHSACRNRTRMRDEYNAPRSALFRFPPSIRARMRDSSAALTVPLIPYVV